MKVNTKSSNLRIIFSALALAGFTLFSLGTHSIELSYPTYRGHMSIMESLFQLIPFVALLLFAILERKMLRINRRVYVAGIFLLYFVQTLFLLFSDVMEDYSIFCCSDLSALPDIVFTILAVRFLLLLLIPVVHAIVLKIYSMAMLALFLFTLLAFLTSTSICLSNEITTTVSALTVDALFHVALYFFSDLLTSENKSKFWLGLADLLSSSEKLWGSEINDETDYESEDTAMNKRQRFFRYNTLLDQDSIEIPGDAFLIDPPQNALLHFDLQRTDNSVTISGYFSHLFSEFQAARILRKKSLLNQTFKDIDLKAQADTHMGIESVEEGEFIINLSSRVFDIELGWEQARNYMLRFMDAIVLIQNTECYG